MTEKVKITLIRSPIKYRKEIKETVRALGLPKLNSTRIHKVTPQILGMIKRVNFLLSVEFIKDTQENK